jgi:hypothetical protein
LSWQRPRYQRSGFMAWRHVAFTGEKKTYPLQTCYEHNMLSLLHAVCFKVLVFFVLVSALQNIQNETYIHMRRVTTIRLKISASVKKETSSPQKLTYVGLTWFRESNLFHHCLINFYQTHICISLWFAFTLQLSTSVTVHVIAQKITDTTHVKLQWAKRFEVRIYAFYKYI